MLERVYETCDGEGKGGRERRGKGRQHGYCPLLADVERDDTSRRAMYGEPKGPHSHDDEHIRPSEQ